VSAPAVLIEGLRKTFRRAAGPFGRKQDKVALDGIDLEVRQGEVFGLLGPNGAGKTTLLKCLCGLVLPDAGRIEVDGRDALKRAAEVRRSVGMVYGDERSFFLRLSLLENLRFYASLYEIHGARADSRIRELLKVVGLADVVDVRMDGFSSGMRQRAAIARGLLNDPAVIFMDEPSRTLDPVGAEDLRELIHDRVAGGRRTVLIATNLMHEAEALCHRLTMIDGGRVVMTGSLADFRGLAGEDAVYWLSVNGGSAWGDGLRSIPGVRSVAVEPMGENAHRIRLQIDRQGRALALAIRHLVEAGAEIWSCTQEEESLDKVFRAVVQRGARAVAAGSRS